MVDGLKSLVHIGVTGFIFISGYYGVSLKWNKVLILYIQITTYCLLSLLLMVTVFGETFTINKLVNVFLSLFDGPWFTSYYFLLILLSPIINKGLAALDKRTFSNIIVLLLFTMYFTMWLHKRPAAISLHLFIIVYLTGRYLAMYPHTLIEKLEYILFFVNLTMLIGIPIMMDLIGRPQLAHYFQGNFCVLNLLTFVPLFLICQARKLEGKGNFVIREYLPSS